MVIRGNEQDWVAFENLRASSEAMKVVKEPKLGQSARTRRGSMGSHRISSNASLKSNSTNPLSSSHRTSSNASLKSNSTNPLPNPRTTINGSTRSRTISSNSVSRPGTPRPSREARASSRRRSSSVSSAQRSRGDREPVPREIVPKPADVIRSRTGSTTETSSSSDSGSGSDQNVPTRVVAPKLNNEGGERGRSCSIEPSRKTARGRSRSRTTTTATSVQSTSRRARSTSRARASTTSQRERSTSRTRPRPVSVHRTRSRSQSLTRITSPATSSYRIAHPRVERRSDNNIGRDISFGWTTQAYPEAHQADTSQQSKSGIMERLFGDQVQKTCSRASYDYRPRTLLAATVYHNTATSLWITTINTNQRGVAKNPTLANKYLKAFSFSTEQEARESAIANAPPKMIPFNESPACFICNGKFAVFRRASHCRNCGVCICSNCATTWSSKTIPDTYNLKKEATVKICKSCDSLSSSFKKALLAGDYEKAVALYGTGNVNLRTPFGPSSKKGETMHPVHCAVEGGNLDVIRWLIGDHFCPIKLIRSASNKKLKQRSGVDTLIQTSKGRTVLSIALERLKVDIMRYLVVECGVSIYECTDLNLSLRALEASLISLPRTSKRRLCADDSFLSARWDKASFDEMSEPSSLGIDEHENYSVGNKTNKSTRTSRSNKTKHTTSDSVSLSDVFSRNLFLFPFTHYLSHTRLPYFCFATTVHHLL